MNRLAFCVLTLAAVTEMAAAQDNPVATVDGAPILESQLEVRAQLTQLEQQAYQIRLRAVEAAVERRLLEKAASGLNLTIEQFLKQQVEDKVPEPSPQEVEGFYWAQKDRLQGQPLEAVRDQLTRSLKSLKLADVRQKLVRSLRDKSQVSILLEPPRVRVDIGNAPRKGLAEAPVTIVEFSDFQCPYCKRAQATLKEVLAKYGDKVSLVYKDLPLPMHPEAPRAAQAARCAGEQGKYWEYHDELFATASLAADSYGLIARKIGIDEAQLKGCLQSGKHRAGVEADNEQARALGVNGTPAFFVNGVFLNGAQPMEAFARIIDQELKSAVRKGSGG